MQIISANGENKKPIFDTWETDYNIIFSGMWQNFNEGVDTLEQFMKGKNCFVQTVTIQPMAQPHPISQQPIVFFHFFITLRKGGEFHTDILQAMTKFRNEVTDLASSIKILTESMNDKP